MRGIGLVELNGSYLTTFQLNGPAYRWWKIYEASRTAGILTLTWSQFSDIFLKEFILQTCEDEFVYRVRPIAPEEYDYVKVCYEVS